MKRLVAIDFETENVYPHGDKIAGWCNNPVVLTISDGSSLEETEFVEGYEKICEKVRSLISEGTMLVAHNAIYERGVIQYQIEVDIRNKLIHDTMALAHCLNSNMKSYGLDNLAKEYQVGSKFMKYDEAKEAGGDCWVTYCKTDAYVTFKLFEKLRESTLYDSVQKAYLLDLRFEIFLCDLEARGVPISFNELDTQKEELSSEILKLKEDLSKWFDGYDIASSQKVNRYIRDKSLEIAGIFTATDLKKYTTIHGISLNDFTLLAIGSRYPEFLLLMEYRKKQSAYNKLVNTYAKYRNGESIVHPSLYMFHKSGRINYTDPAVQTLQKGKPRNIVSARNGFYFLSADYSQIEPRVLASMSLDKSLCRVFLDGEDIYRFIMSVVLGKNPCDITATERSVGKIVVLAAIYGRSITGMAQDVKNNSRGLLEDAPIEVEWCLSKSLLAHQLYATTDDESIEWWEMPLSIGKMKQAEVSTIFDSLVDCGFLSKDGHVIGGYDDVSTLARSGAITSSTATRVIDAAKFSLRFERSRYVLNRIKDRFPGVACLINKAQEDVSNYGYTQTLLGTARVFSSGMRCIKDKTVREKCRYFRQGFNHTIQGTAAEIFKMAAIRLSKALDAIGGRIVLLVHDEFCMEIPLAIHYDAAVKTIRSALEFKIISVPLIAEVSKQCRSWGECK